MPYPTPPEPAAEETLRWFLVAVPDRQEYVRAGLGAYTEMAKDYMWGLEGYESTSEDAAQSWAKAVAATLEALEMGFPDILLGYIDQVEELLEAIRDSQCCTPGGPSPIGFDGQFIGDELDIVEPPGVQPAAELPPGWVDHPDNPGDGSWDLELYRIALCDKANRFVNALTATFRRWTSISSFNAWDFARELVQAIIALVFPGRVDDLLLWAWDAYYDALDALGDWVSGLLGLSVKDAMQDIYTTWLSTERDAAVCAIVQAGTADRAADDVRDILQGLASGAAWSLFWSAFPLRHIMRKMFDMEDGYEGPYQSSCANCTFFQDAYELMDTVTGSGLTAINDLSWSWVAPPGTTRTVSWDFRTEWAYMGEECVHDSTQAASVIEIDIHLLGSIKRTGVNETYTIRWDRYAQTGCDNHPGSFVTVNNLPTKTIGGGLTTNFDDIYTITWAIPAGEGQYKSRGIRFRNGLQWIDSADMTISIAGVRTYLS